MMDVSFQRLSSLFINQTCCISLDVSTYPPLRPACGHIKHIWHPRKMIHRGNCRMSMITGCPKFGWAK